MSEERVGEKAGTDERIEIVPYDPAWPRRADDERRRLLSLFTSSIREIDHIGSTAVPGLSAKPIVDLIAVVDSMEAADELLPKLCLDGYDTSAQYNATLDNRRWLMRCIDGKRAFHLHLVLRDSRDWATTRRLRDLLRGNSDLRDEYEMVKKRLALEFVEDREGYTKAKGAFIARLLDR